MTTIYRQSMQIANNMCMSDRLLEKYCRLLHNIKNAINHSCTYVIFTSYHINTWFGAAGERRIVLPGDASWKRLCSSSVPSDDDDETVVGDIHQPFFYRYNTFKNSAVNSTNVNAVQWHLSQVLSKFWNLFPILQHKNLSMQTVTTFDMKSPCNALYQRIRQSEGIIPSSRSGGPIPLTPHTHTQLDS